MGVRGGRVQLGIDAPRQRKILRSELVDNANQIDTDVIHDAGNPQQPAAPTMLTERVA
ncbi:MAG: carbon storage regulator [Planctomycetota bacterium]